MTSYAPLEFKEWKPQFGTISSFSDDLLKYFDNTMKVDNTDFKILPAATAEETVPNTTKTDLQDPLLPVTHKEMSKSLSTLSSHHTNSVTESITDKEEDGCEEKEEKEEEQDFGDDEEYSINESQVVEQEEEQEEQEEQDNDEDTSEMMEIAKETGSNKIETSIHLSLDSSHIIKDQEQEEKEEEKEEETSSSSSFKAKDKSQHIAQPTVKVPAAPNTMRFLNSSPSSLLPQKRGDKSVLRKSSAYFTQKIRKAKPTVVKDEPVKTKLSWWRKFRFFARD